MPKIELAVMALSQGSMSIHFGNFDLKIHGFTMLRLKVGLSTSKKTFICLNEILLKMMKNAFYFILKALFVLKMFKFLC